MSQEQIPEISKADFIEWQNNPVTKFIIAELNDQYDQLVNHVRAAVRAGDLPSASFSEGKIDGLISILDVQYEDVEDEV